MVKDNILSINDVLDDFNVGTLAAGICERVKARRLELNLTQSAFAKRSGVSLGTLKHFERYGKISLQHLLMLAIALRATEEFKKLFTTKSYTSIDDVVKGEKCREEKEDD